MPKKEVRYFKGGSTSLNEIYQSVGMKFSFANYDKEGNLVQCHEWVKCRDYLHDVIRTSLTGNSSSVYGFHYTLDKNPKADLENMRMLVSSQGITKWITLRSKITKALKIINYIERIAGVELTTVEKVQADKSGKFYHVWMLKGPKMWISSPHLVSMFTFLVRLGDKEIENIRTQEEFEQTLRGIEKKERKKSDNDISYLKHVRKFLLDLVLKREEISNYGDDGFSDNYRFSLDIMTFHNNSGIVGTCTENTGFADVNTYVKETLKGEKG